VHASNGALRCSATDWRPFLKARSAHATLPGRLLPAGQAIPGLPCGDGTDDVRAVPFDAIGFGLSALWPD